MNACVRGAARAARRLVACALALLALVPSLALAQGSRYLDAAVELGRWLDRTTQGATRWPSELDNDGVTLRYGSSIGLEPGAAGIGLFFAQLHEHTRDPRHLTLAVRAAEHEHTFHVREQFGGPDYLGGAAGSGLFLLVMHEKTGDPRYLAWARDAAAWLERTAVRPAPDQAYWQHAENHPNRYIGIPHGAAGIATFQLALHQRTNDASYLADAEDAYRWMRTHALPIGASAIGFRRYAVDLVPYNWWSGGSAGVMAVQAQLYGATGNALYLDDLQRTADGLVATANPATPTGVYWTTNPGASTYRPTVFAHGNASIAPALLLAHELSNDPRHLATANASIAWLAAMARAGSGVGAEGTYWQHNDALTVRANSGLVGSSSVGWAFARMSTLTRAPELRALALASADYLLSTSERPADGERRWINYPGVEQEANWDTQAYNLGWYDGNSGTGLFLLAAHELAIGARPGLEVHAP